MHVMQSSWPKTKGGGGELAAFHNFFTAPFELIPNRVQSEGKKGNRVSKWRTNKQTQTHTQSALCNLGVFNHVMAINSLQAFPVQHSTRE